MFFFCLFFVFLPLTLYQILSTPDALGNSRTHPKVRAFYQCVRVVPVTCSLLGYPNIKSILQSSMADQLLSKKLEASPCCRNSLYSPVPRNESEEQMRTSTLSTADSEWRIFVLCGLFLKAFSGTCVKANSFCFQISACSEGSALAHQGSAPWMCSYSQWCFPKCSEGLGCFDNMFSCKMNSKERKKKAP